ncbi:MAG: PTS lactose/cellobiose transporter subunit IIA [Anaerococcus sp.]|nr:PTS lactose/cellobiose transporter subunit IIA [Anaerococcus sp.]MDD7044382.1 PTS lactose/cellobiose transporter subunit IIA [Peptoniphilaceae bacterium]MDY2918025.1 PTS lactose/cellobiose transporter subunit IIA [Anaerococcus sp.]
MSEVNEQDYELAFQIITYAGDAQSSAIEAIAACENYDFDKAAELINAANKSYIKCHEIQTNMFTNEANGQKTELNIILVHAQDHLTMANLRIGEAKNIMNLYKKIQELENREEKNEQQN